MALRQVLLTCGLPDIKNIDGKRPKQAFINSQGFADIDNFTILAVKNAPYMIKNHNSIHDHSVILGAVHQRSIQALMYWERDQKQQGITTEAANWTLKTMAKSIERVNSNTPQKEVAMPGKVETGIPWMMWDTKWENYLGPMMGASGIPLDYIVRRKQPDGWTEKK